MKTYVQRYSPLLSLCHLNAGAILNPVCVFSLLGVSTSIQRRPFLWIGDYRSYWCCLLLLCVLFHIWCFHSFILSLVCLSIWIFIVINSDGVLLCRYRSFHQNLNSCSFASFSLSLSHTLFHTYNRSISNSLLFYCLLVCWLFQRRSIFNKNKSLSFTLLGTPLR